MDSPQRPNYFLLLGLDPAADDAAVAEAVRAFQQRNSRDVNNPVKKLAAQENLERLPDIRAVLGDPVARAREATAARRQGKAERDAVLADFDRDAATLTADGFLLTPQLEMLARQYKGRLEAEAVRARLAARGVEVRDAPPPRLDRARMGEIAGLLRTLARRDLYDLVGGGPSSATAELHALAGQLERQTRAETERTAAVLARAELAGWCLSLFRSDEARALYDALREEQPLWALDPLLETAAAGGRGVPGAVTVDYLRRAAEAGVPDSLARQYLRELAGRKGWAVEWTVPERPRAAAPAPAGPTCLVEWWFERTGYWTKTVELVIMVTGEPGRLGRLVLVGQVNRTPDGPEDGEAVAEWEPDGPAYRRALAPHAGRGTLFCKLFAVPATAAKVLHPDKAKTAL